MNPNLTKTLIIAAETGDLPTVQRALEEGANPNTLGPNSGALQVAAFNNHKAIVQTLLQAGAKPNQKDHQNFTALQLAASKGHEAISRLLINKGADLEVTTDKGGTALHVAAASGFPKVVNVLTKAGANLEARDNAGFTPLFSASQQGQNGALHALLKAGANPNLTESSGETPLIQAIRRMFMTRIQAWSSEGTNGDRKVKYTLLKGGFWYHRNYDPAQPEQLGKLMSLKDQRYCATQSWGPGGHVYYLDALETIKTLIKAGVDVHATTQAGINAMWLACAAGEAKIITELHKAGARFDAVEDNGEHVGATCLHKVAASGRIDGLEAYFNLTDEYDIHVKDGYGYTPLHYLADQGGHLSIARLLLEKGADKGAKTTKDRGAGAPVGTTPAEIAFHWKNQELGEFLK